jgi:hypothetical protein
VLIANEQKEKESGFNNIYVLRCYNKYREIIWYYTFTDTVESNRGILDPTYSFFFIDTINLDAKKSLYLIASSSTSFSSAVFSIDLKTGKRNTGVLWCSGHTVDGVIKDINGDRKKDIFCIGVDNGFEDIVLFGFEPDYKNKVRTSTTDYQIKNYPIAELITYIRIPKTDYDLALQNRFQAVNQNSLMYLSNEHKYFFILDSDPSSLSAGIWYKLQPNLVDFNISIDDQFRVKRDSLVAQGILNPPFSDTKEYENIIKGKILYWKNGQWVKREDMD